MTALVFLVVLGLVFVVAWSYLGRNRNPRAKLGPDGTNVREPETFVVHHEGKGQGLDIANTALKERTEHLRRDLPGDANKVEAPVPGRDMVKLSSPPSDISRYGAEKVAPGATPGQPGAESKEKVLTEGPVGSRPGTAEEPGSPYAKGRRVTDNHRDVELAADLLPNVNPGQRRRVDRDLAASPSTNGQEPGYGLGATAPGESDGEGGLGEPGLANMTENGPAPRRGRVIQFRSRSADQPEREADDDIAFSPDPSWANEVSGELDWAGLNEEIPLPAHYGEDACTAIVRNPRSLYVYWERSGHGDDNLKSMLGDGEFSRTVPCLRVFDVTSGAYPGQHSGQCFTIDVTDDDDHWFVGDGIAPGREYVVSYERRTADGQYYLLSHSSPVRTPHEGPAPDAERSLLYDQYVRQPGDHAGSPQWR